MTDSNKMTNSNNVIFRVAIIAKDERGARYVRSQLHFKDGTTSVTTCTTKQELYKHNKFHLIIEADYLHQHPNADEIKQIALGKMV